MGTVARPSHVCPLNAKQYADRESRFPTLLSPNPKLLSVSSLSVLCLFSMGAVYWQSRAASRGSISNGPGTKESNGGRSLRGLSSCGGQRVRELFHGAFPSTCWPGTRRHRYRQRIKDYDSLIPCWSLAGLGERKRQKPVSRWFCDWIRKSRQRVFS